ncbi:hypothetical protein M9Y10_036816 [Tritrichomonas musculus]|uniref:Uncharacterized protein n=1 Tax=Tritrichomonas musculus TaxID=1915356 RepID=A0ABR2GTW7_9EUKA
MKIDLNEYDEVKIKINRETHLVGTITNDAGDRCFYMDNPAEDTVDTILTKAEKVIKQNKNVLKTENRCDFEKTLENAMVEFIKKDRYKNISNNPKTYFDYFYFVNGDFELKI